MSTVETRDFAKSTDLPDTVRHAVRDVILVLADSKRLLGMRYGNWILGAPELEAGIACASMAQDEWGHARLLYALLRDFGDDVERLEHGRQPEEYRSIGVLDAEPESWPELVAVNAFVDAALSLQLEALAESAYVPLRQRVQKLLEEESFHAAHGEAWFQRIAGSGDEGRAAMQHAVTQVMPQVMLWFGPDSTRARALQDASITDANGSGMRTRFAERVAPLLRLLETGSGVTTLEPEFGGFDESTRRITGTAPDERTIAQVRGDLNRAFLMD